METRALVQLGGKTDEERAGEADHEPDRPNRDDAEEERKPRLSGEDDEERR